MNRTAKRTDANQQSIIDALRVAGCSVQSLHAVGGGVPDLMVSRAGVVHLLEVKVPGRKRNPRQLKWLDNWSAPVHLVTSPETALLAVGLTLSE